jgi:hypothetical protein
MLHIGYSSPLWIYVILLHLSHDRSKWAPSFFSTTLQNSPVISVILSEVSKFQGYKNPCPIYSTSLVTSLTLSPICWWKLPSSCRMLLFPWNTKFNFLYTSCTNSCHSTQIIEILHNLQLLFIYYYVLWGLLPWYSHYLDFFNNNFNSITSSNLNLVFTIPECLPNSIKWSLSVKHTFLLLYLMYYSGNMFRLSIKSSSGPYIKIQILNLF